MNSVTPASPRQREHKSVMIAAFGMVFANLGTSPRYTLKECFSGIHGVPPTPENVLGILSLIFWGLCIVISLRYVFMALRADNRGEGGLIALYSLIAERAKIDKRTQFVLLLIGLGGPPCFMMKALLLPPFRW